MPTAPFRKQLRDTVPLKMVGGCKFGRFPKISREETWNFVQSDTGLVPSAGWAVATSIFSTLEGRGAYRTSIGNFIIAVIGNTVYRINQNLSLFAVGGIGTLATNTGDVFITENNDRRILITDNTYVYLYDFGNEIFYSSAPSALNPITYPFASAGYCAFQNGRFLVAVPTGQQWVLSDDGLTWTNSAQTVGLLQSKPSFIQAVVPMPGGGNNILIIGQNVAESWQDVGAALFPYQRNSTFNIDYGCLNPASIAELENFVVWLGVNEQSGPVIMYTNGANIQHISTQGIDFQFSQLTNPSNCTGFLFKQDGKLLYQFTFPDDNLSYQYDFALNLFYRVTDENLNYHPARQVVFFNNDYYFVSLNGGNLYEFGTQYTSASYDAGVRHIIPRLRITPPTRLPNQRYFIVNELGFTIENGEQNDYVIEDVITSFENIELATQDDISLTTENDLILITQDNIAETTEFRLYESAIDFSISRDGAESFGSQVRYEMNRTGLRKSRLAWYRVGIANDTSYQFRFSSLSRFVVFDGYINIYQ